MADATLFAKISAQVDTLIAAAKANVKTQADALGAIVGFVGDIIRLLQDQSTDGPAKRAAAIEATNKFYDAVILPIDLPGPDFAVDPILKRFVSEGVGLLVDQMVRLAWIPLVAPKGTNTGSPAPN